MAVTQRWLEEFPALLSGFELATLEADPHSAFALSKDLRLIYVNPAYERFGAENGGVAPALGRPLLSSIHGPLQGLYQEVLAQVLEHGKPWEQEYACHSATTFREYFQVLYPLKDGSGLVCINSVKVTRPMDVAAHEPFSRRYREGSGFVTQCSNCRRTRRADESGLWDWVPAWVRQLPADTSHSICPTCFDYHWRRAPPAAR